MRLPTFSRHSDTETDEPTTVATGSTTAPDRPRPMNDDEPTLTDVRPVRDDRAAANRDANVAVPGRRIGEDRTPAVAGPRPRSSMLATLGLVLGVGSALLVLSGPLLGYGIGVALLALILSLSGISATSKRHVAGRTEAVFGMLLALAAIVVGVLALTGSLSWLGTDTNTVESVRHWLDANTVDRF